MKQQILRQIPFYGLVALLVYMPFHIFLSQSLSLATGGLEVWKTGKDILLCALVLFTICLVFWQGKVDRVFRWLLVGSVVYGALHLILWAAHPDIYGRSAILGTIYNMRLPLFVILGYGAVLLAPSKFVFSSLMKVVLSVSTLVALLGILQYFLPKDILTHLGYSLERGVRPAFFIDDHPDLPRIMSTLREPNALGAYLLLPIAALSALLLKLRDWPRRMMFSGALGLHLLAVLLTFSRSAWLAAALVVGLVGVWHFRRIARVLLRRFWPVALAGLLLIGTVGFILRDTPFVQEYITHATEEEVQDLDSNDYHWLFIKQGLEGIATDPLGHGPGTAGLASIQNPAGSFLTENYYIQIGYELGVLGLALFVAFQVWLYIRLLRRRDMWTPILLASFWGYVLTNMLLHTWANEAVAAQWWLLAGAALCYPLSNSAKRSRSA